MSDHNEGERGAQGEKNWDFSSEELVEEKKKRIQASSKRPLHNSALKSEAEADDMSFELEARSYEKRGGESREDSSSPRFQKHNQILPLASLNKRVLSWVIDHGVLFALIFMITGLENEWVLEAKAFIALKLQEYLNQNPKSLISLLQKFNVSFQFILFLLLNTLFIALPIGLYGRSFGQKFLKLTVMTRNQRVGLIQGLFRDGIVRPLIELCPPLYLSFFLLQKSGRALHDYLAGTYVFEERS